MNALVNIFRPTVAEQCVADLAQTMAVTHCNGDMTEIEQHGAIYRARYSFYVEHGEVLIKDLCIEIVHCHHSGGLTTELSRNSDTKHLYAAVELTLERYIARIEAAKANPIPFELSDEWEILHPNKTLEV